MTSTHIRSSDGIVALFFDLGDMIKGREFTPNSSIVDCHIHTYFSDAIGYSLNDFLQDLDKKKLSVFSLTEHDNFNSTPLIMDMISGRDCTFIPGIELSTGYTPYHNMHIKGFFSEMPKIDSRIMQYCIDTCEKRVGRMQKVIDIVNSQTKTLTIPDAWVVIKSRFSIDSILRMSGKPPIIEGRAMPPFLNTYMLSSMLAEALDHHEVIHDTFNESVLIGIKQSVLKDASMRLEFMSEEDLKIFHAKYGVTIEDHYITFKDNIDWNNMIEHVLLLPDAKGYKPFFYVDKPNELTPDEAIALIRDSNGVTELAHPYETYGDNTELLKSDLNRFDFDGIEIYSPKNPRKYVEIYSSIASALGKYVGFGSDTHGHITRGKRELGVLRYQDQEEIGFDSETYSYMTRKKNMMKLLRQQGYDENA